MDKIDLTKIKPNESYWEISWDGYYPYCYKCGYEPRYGEGVSERCPNCKKKMVNYEDLK